MTMKRDACLKLLARYIPDDIVVSTYTSAFDWMAIRPHPLNYLAVGAMGLASSHGLGIALAEPQRRVAVIDGDGSLLMNLGTLATVAGAGARNFFHFLSANGTYEANGGHPLPAAERLDFAGLARAAGYRAVFDVFNLEQFETELPAILAAAGPVFVVMHIEPGEDYPQQFAALHSANARAAFSARVAADRSQAADAGRSRP
jgi:phosphonopyruvate decarboxylase